MDCEQILNLISARLDNELNPEESKQLEAHLAECPSCQASAEAFALQHQDLQASFASRQQAVQANTRAVQARLAQEHPAPGPAGMPARRRSLFPEKPWARAALVLGTLAAAACVVLALRWWYPGTKPPGKPGPGPQPGPMARASYLLTPRALPAAPETPAVAVGEQIETRAGERRRVRLPDGSILYVNENTQVHLTGTRRARLEAGTVFVEVEPRSPEQKQARFVVETPGGNVVALGTKFQVQSGQNLERVLVTQGKVQVQPATDEAGQVVEAGQQLDLTGQKPRTTPLPRASHVLDWTRDLMVAAETPLIPASNFAGGALIAVDSSGQEAKLTLRKYHIDVHIEDGFARTTIDQTYFNHHPWRLEGTFYFPLPPDASLSRLAMYVDGKLMEGGMAERSHARAVYEQIVSSQRDPALLEWVDGTTFKMRVFPLEGRQEKRILLSYTQRLSNLYGQMQYRFPAGHSLQLVRDWSFHARVQGGVGFEAVSPTHPKMTVDQEGNDLILNAREEVARVDRDVVINLTPKNGPGVEPNVRFGSAEEDARYLMLRYRPQLETRAQRQRRDWVFLFESSADRNPLLARVQIEVIRHLLANAEHDDTFTILCAGTFVRRFPEQPALATPENIARAVSFLEGIHLVGALDLGRAFAEAETVLAEADNPCLVHLGSGMTSMGEPEKDLYGLLPPETPYVGVGVGKRWGRSFMKECARLTGGYFTQINPDEPIAWRSFDLLATLNTPRLLDVKVQGLWKKNPLDHQAPRFLSDRDSLSQGEELFAVTRLERSEEGQFVLPDALLVSGTLDGKEYIEEVPVGDVVPGAGYLPRTWAKLELDRLLAEDAQKHRERIIALSKAMYVMTPFTSLLVLESEEMYKQFQVDRGRKDHWALYPAPDQIPVVYEPDPNQPVDVRNAPQGLKPASSQVQQTIRTRGKPTILQGGPQNSIYLEKDGKREFLSLGERGDTEPGFLIPARTGGDNLLTMFDTDKGVALRGGEFLGRMPTLAKMPALYMNYFYKDEANKRIPQQSTERANTNALTHNYFHLLGMPDSPVFSPDGRWLATANGELSTRNLHGHGGQGQGLPIMGEMFDRSGLFNDESVDGLWEGRPSRRGEPQVLQSLFAGTQLDSWSGKSLNGTPASEKLREADLDFQRDRLVLGLQRRLDQGQALPSLLYSQPNFTGDQRLFQDLTVYAPGLNTSEADIQAVLEAEAMPQLRDAPGTIDPDARPLFERARQGGWYAVTLGAGEDEKGTLLVFDARGRYRVERVLPMGLREIVVCDGENLWHLYPDLGLAAHRTVSRFHRALLARQLPWLVVPPEDLAHGADLKRIAENTVAVIPHSDGQDKDQDGQPRPHLEVHLVFSPAGPLAERRVVAMPANKLLYREVYEKGAGGHGGTPASPAMHLVRILDARDKELARFELAVESVPAPNLIPDTQELVVLPLPFRGRQYTYPKALLQPSRSLGDDQNGCFQYLEQAQALELLSTALGENNGPEASLLVHYCFHNQGDHRLGFYTILAACGVDLNDQPDFVEQLTKQPHHPLLRYLGLHSNGVYSFLQRRVPVNLGPTVGDRGSFFQRLALAHDIYLRWQKYPRNDRFRRAIRPGDVQQAVAFVRDNPSLPLAWALLSYVQSQESLDSKAYQSLADTWGMLAEKSKSYTARYEQARCLNNAGRRDEARQLWLQLHHDTLKKGLLPPLDSDHRWALQGSGDRKDLWSEQMRQTVADLIARDRRAQAVLIAWQVQQLGDRPLADVLLNLILKGTKNQANELATHLGVFAFLWQTNQLDRAESILEDLLDHKEFKAHPGFWRLGSRLCVRRGLTDQAIRRLERALDLEYENLPDQIDLRAWRQDYSKLLNHYQSLTAALQPLDTQVPGDLVQRTIRAVDRWRAHDLDESQQASACARAAAILRELGQPDLAWEYQTTSVGHHPGDTGPWLNLARTLSRENQPTLANRAYEAASRANREDALIVWEQAMHLRQMGEGEQANQLLRRLANEQWPDSYRGIRTRARWQLANN
jgi:ferric-dicitrate binding protein FerR (iron transport regulator)/tetratricopeptide (TPR) repeat protein